MRASEALGSQLEKNIKGKPLDLPLMGSLDQRQEIVRRDRPTNGHCPNVRVLGAENVREGASAECVDHIAKAGKSAHGKSLHLVRTPVNTARSDWGDTVRGSMSKEEAQRKRQGERLRRARMTAGYRSAREAALANHWPESSYRAHESGTRTIGQDDAERYTRRFRALGVPVTAEEVLFDKAAKTASPEDPTAAISRVLDEIMDRLKTIEEKIDRLSPRKGKSGL